MYFSPLALRYRGYAPADIEGMVAQLARKIHMKPACEKLLSYYCTVNSSGFRPAASLITRETGLAKRTIYAARKELVERNIIGETKDAVIINWRKLCGTASLPMEAFCVGGKQVRWSDVVSYKRLFTQEEDLKDKRDDYGWFNYDLLLLNGYEQKTEAELSDEDKRYFSVLEKMSERDYNLIADAFTSLKAKGLMG